MLHPMTLELFRCIKPAESLSFIYSSSIHDSLYHEKMFRNFLAISIAVVATVYHVSGHGKLMEPPNRSSLWRFPEFAEYNPPANYNDNENYCGGAGVSTEP